MGQCIKCGCRFVGTPENPPGDGLCHYCERNQLKAQLEAALKRAERAEAACAECDELREVMKPLVEILSELAGRMQGHGWGCCGTYQISNAQLYDQDLNRINEALARAKEL